MSASKEGGINAKLVQAINGLLSEVMGDDKKKGRPKKLGIGEEPPESYTLDQKLKVLDRALKLEALRLKVTEDGEGSGFDD
jgi:hypothetical protein